MPLPAAQRVYPCRCRALPVLHACTARPQWRAMLTLLFKLCGGFYNSKKQNLFKKTDKKSQLLHKTKIKSRNASRTLFFKVRCRPKAAQKRMSFARQRAYLSKKPCVATGTGQGAVTSSAAFRRRLRRLPKIRRHRSRSCRRRKALPVWGRWGTWPARAGDALRQPRPHGCCQTH